MLFKYGFTSPKSYVTLPHNMSERRLDRFCGNRNRVSKKVENGSDSLILKTEFIPQLAQFVKPGSIPDSFGNFEGVTQQRFDPELGVYYDITVILPKSVEPPVTPKKIKWGGGRVIGGGRSKEAIRRAKKKEKKNSKE